jgi:hypothetical protein
VKGGLPVTPFGENNWLRSTKGLKTDSYTLAKESVMPVTIDGVPGQRALQKGTVIAKITSGPDAGKVGPFQAAGTAEVQTLTPTTVTAGTFTLTYNGATTAPIVWNASAAVIQSALEALNNIEPGDILAAGGPVNSTPVTVTFYGTETGNVNALTVSNTSLTGTIAITTSTAGVAGAADGRGVLTNIVGILNTWLPWELMERDATVSVAYEAAAVQAWCIEYDAAGLAITLTDTTAAAMFAKKNLDIRFK